MGFRQPFRILSFKPASWHFRTTRYLKQAVNKNTKNTPCVKVASVRIRSIQWAQTVDTDCLAPCLVLTIDWPLFMLQDGNNQWTRFIDCSFTHSSICSYMEHTCIRDQRCLTPRAGHWSRDNRFKKPTLMGAIQLISTSPFLPCSNIFRYPTVTTP